VKVFAAEIAEIMDDPGLSEKAKDKLWARLNERLDEHKLPSTWSATEADVPFLRELRDELKHLAAP
jgi:hypothetical protein